MYEYDFIDVPWQGYITGIMFCRSDGFFWSQIFLQCSWYALVQLQALSDSSSGWSQAFFFYPVDIYGSDRNSESLLRGQVLWPQDWVRPLEWIIWACFTVFLSSAYYTIQVKFVFDMTCLPHTTASSKSALLTIVNTPLIAAAETCCGFPVAWWCLTLCDPKDCSTRGLPAPHHHPKFARVHVHCISDAGSHLILWRPLLLLSSIFPSIRDFSNESAVPIRWPKYWSFTFSFSLSKYSGLICLEIDWFDLLAVYGTFRNLLQYHSSKASILWRSAFFMVQLSQPYLTTGKTIASTIQTFVGRVMSLLFNTLSRFVIAFLMRSNCLLISCGCSNHLQWF